MGRINSIEPIAKLEYVTDGNILTYFQARDTSCYLAYDLGESTLIERIVFLRVTMIITFGPGIIMSYSIRTE